MPDTITLNPGDACPACGGELREARVPSPEGFKKLFDRENPLALGPKVDSMRPEQRVEQGALFICEDCDYKHRFPLQQQAGRSSTSDRDRSARGVLGDTSSQRQLGGGAGDRTSADRGGLQGEQLQGSTDDEEQKLRAQLAEIERRRGAPPGNQP